MSDTIKDVCRDCDQGFTVEAADISWKCPVCNTINCTGTNGKGYSVAVKWKSRSGQDVTDNPSRNRFAREVEKDWGKKLRSKGLL